MMLPEDNDATTTEEPIVADPAQTHVTSTAEGTHSVIENLEISVANTEPTSIATDQTQAALNTPLVDHQRERLRLIATLFEQPTFVDRVIADYQQTILTNSSQHLEEWSLLYHDCLHAINSYAEREQAADQHALDVWHKAHHEYCSMFESIKKIEDAIVHELSSLNEQAEPFQQSPSDLRDRLLNYRKGLEIIQRMIKRLHDRRKTFECPSITFDQLTLPLGMPEFGTWPAVLTTLGTNYQVWQQQHHHFQNHVLKLADQIQHECVQWLKHLIGAFDGLEAGHRGEDEFRSALESQWADSLSTNRHWLGLYARLEPVVDIVLAELNVQLSIPTIGTMFVPDQMEPIATVADPLRQNEEVASVLRRGYLYQGRMLRPSMVEVVMNSATDSPE